MNQENKEIIQDVIDRLLYLSPNRLKEYKNQLSQTHESFGINESNRVYLSPRAV